MIKTTERKTQITEQSMRIKEEAIKTLQEIRMLHKGKINLQKRLSSAYKKLDKCKKTKSLR